MFQKTLLKAMSDFLTLKNVTISSSVDQNKKFLMLILHENLELALARENFLLKKLIFTNWSKTFLGLTKLTSLQEALFGTPCIFGPNNANVDSILEKKI